jgi:hypothetical protein
MLQPIAQYWFLWLVLFIGLRGYIKYNNSCRAKRMQAVGVKRDFSGLTEEEIKQHVLQVLRATLTGVPQVWGAAMLSWVTALLFLIALFENIK